MTKIQEYQQDALRTCKIMDTSIHNSIHMTLGITSEYFELMSAINKAEKFTGYVDEHILLTEHVKDEAGDVLWYLLLLAYFNKLDVSSGNYIATKYSPDTAIERINSIFKANWIYDRALVAQDKTGIAQIDQLQDAIVSLLDWIIETLPFKLDDIMDYNIEKLKKRYPEKFEANLANNRKEDTRL